MIPFGQYGVEYENVTPAPKVGLGFFCTTICQGSAVRKVIYIYIYIQCGKHCYVPFFEKGIQNPLDQQHLEIDVFFLGGHPPSPPQKSVFSH